jgi:hypothetical protein
MEGQQRMEEKKRMEEERRMEEKRMEGKKRMEEKKRKTMLGPVYNGVEPTREPEFVEGGTISRWVGFHYWKNKGNHKVVRYEVGSTWA